MNFGKLRCEYVNQESDLKPKQNMVTDKILVLFFQTPISSFPPGFFVSKMLLQTGRNPEVKSGSFSAVILTSQD